MTSSKVIVDSSKSPQVPELLTAKDLEALLKINVKTIYTYVQRGLIPYVRIESNVRFPKHQIVEWIQDRNYTPRPIHKPNERR